MTSVGDDPRPVGLPVDANTAKIQADASHPRNSAWVAANAGSGKTFVLARRVVRLLLAGVDPSRILCLTFTKAAAAEMAKRVFEELGRWTTLSDDALSRELAEIEGSVPGAAMLAEARRLFARALDTPGGLKIQTIHALCERLLHQFPLEANVAGHFEVLDDRGQQNLTDEARRLVLAGAADGRGPLGVALSTVLAPAADRTVDESVAAFVAARDEISVWIANAGGFDRAVAGLKDELGESETSDALWRRILDDMPIDAATIRTLLERLRQGKKRDVSAAQRLEPFVDSGDADIRIEAWLDFFMSEAEFRDVTTLATKAIRDAMPGLEDKLVAESARLETLIDRIRTAELYESTVAMLQLAGATIDEYARLKQAIGALDFEDLIIKTVRLLARSDASRWVHYKLDRGLDHILVDEAQDTSPRQWQVIRALAGEFFAGEGAGAATRTLFAVGDEKQSIFSFQGAVPAWFSLVQREFGKKARGADYRFVDLELHLSFRSTPVILAAVDEVFKPADVHRGLTAELKPPVHTARRLNQPGRVVIWPPFQTQKKDAPTDWKEPVDHLGRSSPEVLLAKRIAGTVDGWLKAGTVLDAPDDKGRPRPIRPGGILILTRSRGALTEAINRELKNNRIPIAGADRLVLTEHIAVMDLMALGRVVLTPEDDLSLAALLKSPLVGLGEDALFALAHGRKGTLWSALGKAAAAGAEQPEFRGAKALIEAWRGQADFRDPHGFYARILGAGRGRHSFLRRLGPEADDVLDEFLAEALAYERVNTPSLEGFLAWLEASETEIRRDTDTLRDEVRVMTVHGAKGLEADIVFLVDNGSRPSAAVHDPRVMAVSDDPDPDRAGPVVWNRSISQMPERLRRRIEAWRLKSEEEYRRLLYVGMTRARDRLYVVGIRNQNTGERSWHTLVKNALAAECREEKDEQGEVTELLWRPSDELSLRPPATPVAAMATRPDLPGWIDRPAPLPPPVVARLSPSAALPPENSFAIRASSPTIFDAATGDALARGRLIHRLLQSLPDHVPERRADVAGDYLQAFAGTRRDRDALVAEVMAILDDERFAAVFAVGSRAEVEIAGSLMRAGGAVTIAGRLDRLAVTAERVLVVDYKTNRPAPDSLAEVPREYVGQLALYRRVLSRLYPDRPVVAAILWTDTPSLMEIPAKSMDSAEVAIVAG